MDTLTFGTDYLVRSLTNQQRPLQTINLKEVLNGFEMDYKQFVDLCILCGCDYMDKIGGLGHVGAFKMLK